LLMILYDLIYEDLSVGDIYRKKDRIEYIESLKQRLMQENMESSDEQISENTREANNSQGGGYKASNSSGNNYYNNENTDSKQQSSSANQQASNANHNSKRGDSYHINRKTLIPSPHKLTITHARILKIFNELKALAVDDYPNAVSVLFRVFIELSVDCFITNKSLIDSRLNVDSTLAYKINAVAAYFEINKILTKHELRAIRQMTASENQTQSIRTFHSYIHNKDVTPSSTDLKSAWDDIWTFIEQVWR